MGVIQSSINNLLATATIAAKLAPGVEVAGEARKAARNATKMAEFASTMEGTDEQKMEVDKKMLKAGAEAIKKSTELFEENPTQKNYDRINKFKTQQSENYKTAKQFKDWYGEQQTAEASKVAAEDARRAEIARRAETALKWETERVRNSTHFRTYQDDQEKQGQKLFGGNQ